MALYPSKSRTRTLSVPGRFYRHYRWQIWDDSETIRKSVFCHGWWKNIQGKMYGKNIYPGTWYKTRPNHPSCLQVAVNIFTSYARVFFPGNSYVLQSIKINTAAAPQTTQKVWNHRAYTPDTSSNRIRAGPAKVLPNRPIVRAPLNTTSTYIYISGCGLLTPRRWYAPTNPRTESKPFYLVLLVREKILIQRSGKIKKRPSPIIKIKKYKNCLRVPTIQYLSTNPTLPTFNLLPPFPFVWRFRVFANNVSST